MFFFLITFFCLFVYCVCLHAHMPQCTDGGRRATRGFSPSTKWVLGTAVARLETSTIIH